MPNIGPQLPPELSAKRKRELQDAEDGTERDEPRNGTTSKRRRSLDEREDSKRIIGPMMPPMPRIQNEQEPDVQQNQSAANAKHGDTEEDSDDDDFGPALPPDTQHEPKADGPEDEVSSTSVHDTGSQKIQQTRDAWMTMPPKQDDLEARFDPSKQRARGFNMSKGPRRPEVGAAEASIWQETAAQRQRRLANEMLGITDSTSDTTTGGSSSSATVKAQVRRTESKPREEPTRQRASGPSLMEQHQRRNDAEDQQLKREDDPSSRAFDREKDMGLGGTVNNRQRRDLLQKAKGFNSNFAGGGYL